MGSSRARMIGSPHNVSLAGAISRSRVVQFVCVFLSDSLPHPPPSLARYLGAMVSTSIRHVGIVRSYARGSEIVHEDEPANWAYEVLSGTVCTFKTLREGRRQVTGFYFPGDVFGLESAKNTASPPKRSPTLSFGFSKNKH